MHDLWRDEEDVFLVAPGAAKPAGRRAEAGS